MRQVSHTRTVTVGDLIARGARRLKRAKVFFGHGTDNAVDDAAVLVLHTLKLRHDAAPAIYSKRVSPSAQKRV